MSELGRRHDAVMGAGAPMFYDEPIELVRGDGVWLWDSAGTRYLDVYNNVPCVGHANPRVAEAIGAQMATLNVHSRYLHESVIAYAERLAALHHPGLTSMVFTCSGTEAIEVAIMMARAATGGRGIIGTDATYHGNSNEVSQLTRLPAGTSRGTMRSIPVPQRFRPMEAGLDDEQLCQLHLDALQAQIAELEADGTGLAGLLLCSIQANEGLPDIPGPFLRRATELVHRAGGLVIADEVQAGFARSGSWWGYETTDFEPDIVTMGKPMGNGLPVAATMASHELISDFRARHRYFNTFAASPIQAAAGAAVIDEIQNRDLVVQVDRIGRALRQQLSALQTDHPTMGDVRGEGLFIGIDWVKPGTTEPDVEGAARMVEAMKARQVLMGRAGQHGNVLKIRPPLVFGDEHADLLFDTLTDALQELDGSGH